MNQQRSNSLLYALPIWSVLLVFVPLPVFAIVTHFASNTELPALDECLERLRDIRQSEQQVGFATYSGEQSTGVSGAKLYWKEFDADDARALIQVTAPPARRGVSLLILQEDQSPPGLHMYLPELRSVRRVTGNTLSGTLLGTDFTYEDFLHIYGLAGAARLEQRKDEELNERQVFVVDMEPADEHSSYEMIRSYIDQRWCVPLKVEFYTKAANLRKTLNVDAGAIKDVNGHHIPIKLEMRDLVQDTRTQVTVESITVNDEIKDSLFSLSHLRSGH